MIVLDTNVISELMKDDPNENVLRWMELQPTGQMTLTSITLAELLDGINRLPAGRRRRKLAENLANILDAGLHDRCLAFDQPAAHAYGEIVPQRFTLGRPISIPDGQIAAIARSVGATLATRNTKDFVDIEIDLVNPWDESPATSGA
jgi:predicted nucleic acid-binding protein